jgi:hypothetical protein
MTPVSPSALATGIAARLDLPGTPRCLLDGLGTAELARDVAEALRALSRVPLVVPASSFWRPAGERFQHGREDWQAFRDSWLDAAALRREVLDAVPAGSWLPALWDVERDRSARALVEVVPERAALLVHGLFLQGVGLPAELVVHVTLSPAALRRRGVPEWQLEAFTSYEEQAPGCDVLVRAEDPLRPAVRWSPS